ncbi:MAG: RNA polymerase sigma-70 factor [Muribaculaceae bacterium]|nr:RNA polymerase sigma-70 factor [Muribaculaceae bacterium]
MDNNSGTDKNRQFFTRVYNLYHAKCMLFARSYTHSQEHAEDIVADALMVLWTRLESGEIIELPLPFLMQVIRNKALQYLRREMFKANFISSAGAEAEAELRLRMSSLEECMPSELYYSEVKEILDRSLADMPERTRSVFMMSRFQCMSNAEIAAELGIGVKGVEYHITRALRRLKHDLRDYQAVLLFFL